MWCSLRFRFVPVVNHANIMPSLRRQALIVASCVFPWGVGQPAGSVLTVVGSQSAGSSDGYGSAASFKAPTGLAMDAAGRIALVADTQNNCIRYLVVSSGLVTTVAGSHDTSGFVDGVGTLEARFSGPYDVAMTAAGDMAYVADTYNFAVRKINVSSSIVQTLAVSGSAGTADGQGSGASFFSPSGIAINAAGSMLIIADHVDDRVRRCDVASGVVTSVAGASLGKGVSDGVGTASRFHSPFGVALNGFGSFALVVDSTSGFIRRVDLSSSTVTTLAGNSRGIVSDGTGAEANFNEPNGVGMDSAGTVAIVAETSSSCIRRINVSSAAVTTVAGTCNKTFGFLDGWASNALFSRPIDAALDAAGTFALIADNSNNAIRYLVLQAPSTTSSSTASGPLPSPSPSLTATAGSAQTVAETPSLSGTSSQSVSSSPSLSASQTTSPPPFTLMFTKASIDISPTTIHTAIISDANPLLTVHAWLNRCPTDALHDMLDKAEIVCSLARENVFSGPIPMFFALKANTGDLSATAPARVVNPCTLSSTDYVRLEPVLSVGAFFRAPSCSSSLVCEVLSANADRDVMARASLILTSTPTLWPLWDDAIVVGAAGLMRSARLGLTLNTSGALMSAAVSSGVCVYENDASATCSSSMHTILASPGLVLAAAQSAWSGVALPNSSAPFTLTLSGSSRVVLRGAHGLRSFSNGSNATLGGAACKVSAVSDDGVWAVLDSPDALQLCGTVAHDCGYATLRIRTAPVLDMLGVTLSCPPFCPGAVWEGGQVPIAMTDSRDGDFMLGVEPSTAMGSLPMLLPPLGSTTSEGIYYAVSCTQTGVWTDPSSGACQNASDPNAYTCAYGGGGGCTVCPTGALCPGGSRLWARVGFWAPNDAAVSVVPCAPPDPAAKCQGWDIAAGAVRCGPAYRASSYLCGACAGGFYPYGDGSCTACPVVASLWDRYRILAELLLGVLGAACVVGFILAALVTTVGGTLWGSSRRLLDLAQWVIVSLQTLSQAAPASSLSLPPVLATLFYGLAALQVEGVLLPSACVGEYPFQTEVGVMGVALCLTSITASVALYGKQAPAWLRDLGVVCLRAVLLLYPVVAKDAMSLLSCSSVSLSPAGASSLDGGPVLTLDPTSSLRASLVSLEVLSNNPLYVCWAPGGSHRPAGILAAIVLVVVVIGIWLVTFVSALLVQCAARVSILNASDENSVMSPRLAFLAPFLTDYRSNSWYTRHADLLFTVVLAALQALLLHPRSIGAICAKTAVTGTAALALAVHALYVRPFIPAHAWRVPVRAALLLLTLACSVVNAAVSATEAGLSSPNREAVFSISIVLIVFFCIVMCILVRGVAQAMLHGVREEQKAIEARLALAAAQRDITVRRLRDRNEKMPTAPESGSVESNDTLRVDSTDTAMVSNHAHPGGYGGGPSVPMRYGIDPSMLIASQLTGSQTVDVYVDQPEGARTFGVMQPRRGRNHGKVRVVRTIH